MINKDNYNNIDCGTMSIIQNIISCMRGYGANAYGNGKSIKIKFGVPLEKLSQKSCQHLPKLLFDLLVYLAQEGIKTNDLFRRPGNSNQMKKIIEMLSNGIEIEWSDYNIYTVANVVKKYFINLPGGLFGRKFEMMLLGTYSMTDDQRRSIFHKILHQLPNANRELAILIFGILFRMVSHYVDEYSLESENNRDKNARCFDSKCTEFVLAEAVAKSVAGSIFHLCTSSPQNVEKAAIVLQGLILDFPSFDEEFVDFYYRSTLISYDRERYFQISDSRKQSQHEAVLADSSQKLSFKLSNIPNIQKEPISCPQYCEPPIMMLTNPYGRIENMSTDSSPVFKNKFPKLDIDDISLKSTKSSDYDKVQQRQLDMMRLRSNWFLTSISCSNINRKPENPDEFCFYESNEGSINMNSDSNLQFQIVATSGPDILQSFNNKPNINQNGKNSFNLAVPNRADIRSLQSSLLSSGGNTSRSSFVDEVYSDYSL